MDYTIEHMLVLQQCNNFIMKVFFRVLIILLVQIFFGIDSFCQSDAFGKNILDHDKSTLIGTVIDSKTSLPLPGATIYLPDIKIGAIADDKGNYKIQSLNSGKYLVEVSYQGYTTAIETIVISGETTHNFSLTESVREQDAVVVTGVSFATKTKQNPQPVSIVKRNDLLNITSSNVMDALSKSVPGLSVLTTGPAIAKPFIRGLGYNRVVTVNDGVRQEGQQWGDEHGIEVDDYSVQRIDVLKGPASLMYGSDALAGVINIQSQLAAPEGTLKADFQSEYQTNNSLRGFYGNVGSTNKGFFWNAYADYKGAEDYKNKYDGYVFNSKFYNKNIGAMAGFMGSWGNAKILLTKFDQHLGIVEGERDSATGSFTKPIPGGGDAIATANDFKKVDPEAPFQHIRHFKITSDNSFNLGKDRIEFVTAFQRNQRQEFGNPDDINTPNASFDLKTVTYSLRFYFPPNKNWKTSLGANGMYQNNVNRANEVIIPNYNLFDVGAFVYTQYIKNKFSVSGGVRIDNRHVEGKSMIVDGQTKFQQFTKNFSNLSGSVGVAYQAANNVTLKLNLAHGFRAPNFAELASNGAHEGTNRYEIGNNNLKSEVSTQADAGLEFSNEHVSITASIYYNHINDFIFYERVANSSGGDSIVYDPETEQPLQVFRFDQHNANLYGAEAHIDIHPHPLDWLHVENTFSYTRGRFTTDISGSNNLPFIPAARLISEVKGNFAPKGKSIRNIYLSFGTDYTFKQTNAFTAYNTETATSSYLLLNAGLGADISNKGKTICSIHLAANNISNIAYQNHLSRLKYTDVNNVTGRTGVYDMGRNFSLKLDVPISVKI